MATSPIYSWPEPDNTDLVKNGALAIRTLGNAIDTTMGTMVAKTIIDAKGDLIAGTAADTAARLAVGNNGETLVADSAATTGLRYSATPSASNPVLNSAMQIAQRGTSIAVAASTPSYTLDRYYFSNGANQASVVSRQATGDTTNLPNIQYCARVQRNSGQTGTGNVYFGQSLESVNSIPFAGKTVTFSFYARAGANYSATSNAMPVFLNYGTGTDQNVISGYTGGANVVAQTATLTTTWQRFSYSGSVPSTATELGFFFQETPTGTASTNDYFEVTGVQIDIGSVALPFRTYAATIQGELAACQRYYYRASSPDFYSTFGNGNGFSTTQAQIIVNTGVPMRVEPTSVDYSTLAIFDGQNPLIAVTAVAFYNQGNQAVSISCTTAALTQYRPYVLISNNSSSGYIGFSAEL